jgi:hypothetical protein
MELIALLPGRRPMRTRARATSPAPDRTTGIRPYPAGTARCPISRPKNELSRNDFRRSLFIRHDRGHAGWVLVVSRAFEE